jgi:hypothetical protein
MISLSVPRKLLVCHQFIERTEMGGGSQQIDVELSRIIPGDWGKVESGWLAQLLLERIERFAGGGRIHQFLWRRSRAVSTREKGTEE